MSGPPVPPPETIEVRPGEGLDWERLDAALRRELPELEGALVVRQFPNGSANLTYRIEIGGRPMVVRRPPFGSLAPGAHDMAREYRTLSRLWRAYDRAPRAFLFCDDHDVIGSDFLVIEYRTGEVVRGVVPEAMRSHPDLGHRLGLALADALADLHLVDAGSVGLGDLGRPDGFLERQLTGWRKRWSLVASDDGGLTEEIGARLARTMPMSQPPVLLHNDFKLDNCQFNPADPDRVTSVFDWDMATLGDPLVDLGTLLNYWPDPSDTADAQGAYHEGMESMGLATRAEVVNQYVHRSNLDATAIHWYECFAAWKTSIVLHQLYDRWRRGESTDARMEERGQMAAAQRRRAAGLLGIESADEPDGRQ